MLRRIALFLCLLGAVAWARPLWAGETPVASNPGAAIRLGRSALEHFRAERWQQALDEFTAADAVTHSPVFGLYMARCLQKGGRWVEALAKFRDVANLAVAQEAPEPWQQARSAAEAERAALEAAIPRVLLRLPTRASGTLSIAIDDKPLEIEQGTADINLDPGRHVLRVTRGTDPLEVRQFELRPAQRLLLALGPYDSVPTNPTSTALAPTAQVSKARDVPRSSDTRPASPPARAAPGASSRRAATVAMGIGFLGVGVGVVTGLVAWQERNAISKRCDGWTCPPDVSNRIERGHQLANIATVALTTAAVGFAVGGMFFYYAPSASSRKGALTNLQALEIGVAAPF